MGKYRDHYQFGANAPRNWRDTTTVDSYLLGLGQVAPPGMRPRRVRGERFQQNTREPQSAKWHHNYDHAMFDGTCIPRPTHQAKQLELEAEINGIEHIPKTKGK